MGRWLKDKSLFFKIKLIQSFILPAVARSIGSSSRLIGGNTRRPAVASLGAAERQALRATTVRLCIHHFVRCFVSLLLINGSGGGGVGVGGHQRNY